MAKNQQNHSTPPAGGSAPSDSNNSGQSAAGTASEAGSQPLGNDVITGNGIPVGQSPDGGTVLNQPTDAGTLEPKPNPSGTLDVPADPLADPVTDKGGDVVETVQYADGSSATGSDLPTKSPLEQKHEEELADAKPELTAKLDDVIAAHRDVKAKINSPDFEKLPRIVQGDLKDQLEMIRGYRENLTRRVIRNYPDTAEKYQPKQ